MYQAISMGAVGIHLPFDEAALLASRYGFKGIEIDIKGIPAGNEERVKERLAELHLTPAGFGLPVEFRASEEQFKAGIKKLPELAERAAKIGMRRCATYIFSWSDELDFTSNYALHRDRLREAAQILADNGIRLGLEFLGPKTLRDGHPYAFIHTMDQMLELCSDIGTGNTGLLLDAWHWYTAGHDVADIKALEDEELIVYVHINDAPLGIPVDQQIDLIRTLPGETGVIDIDGFFEGLQTLGYTGPVLVEPFADQLNSMPPEKVVELVKQTTDRVWI